MGADLHWGAPLKQMKIYEHGFSSLLKGFSLRQPYSMVRVTWARMQ